MATPPAPREVDLSEASEPGPVESSEAVSGSAAAQREVRLAKLETLRARGVDPYPVTYPRDHSLAEIRERYGRLAAGEETQDVVRVAGRVMLERRQGGLDFLQLKDESGTLQLMASRKEMGEEAFADVDDLDLGDWIGAEGRVIVSRTGELSVFVHSLRLLGKALRPLPAKGHAITDPELRARQRYLDLIVNPESRRVADVRTRTVAAVRSFLAERGFTEVETPVLQSDAGGATARPFITHHNALDITMYLRIALELHLKRLIVGGFERVFEIGRVFRNEGVDTRHNPEFTMLEAYQALADYHDMMELTEEMVAAAARSAIGTTLITARGVQVDLAPPWRRATMVELIKEHTGLDVTPATPIDEARRVAEQAEVEWEESWGAGKIVDEIYDAHVEHLLDGPVFVMDHPRETSPLARAHRDDPTLVERFEVVVAGRELANAYSELTDPVDQRTRFEAEARAKAAGDDEAGDVDEDYLRAMELGMPPTGGLGVGVDRLVMLLAGAEAIRDVILFPTLRPEGGAGAGDETATPAAAPQPTPVNAAPSPAAGERLRLAAPERPPGGHRVALAALVVLAGLGALLAPVRGLNSRIDPIDAVIAPLSVRAGGSVASVVIGLVLLLVAGNLLRGKRTAWWIAVVLLGGASAMAIVKGPHPVAAILALAVLVALVWFRDDFRARSDPPSLWAAARFVPIWLGAVVVYGLIALLTQADRVHPGLTFGGMLETVFGGLVGLDGPYVYEQRLFGEFFPASLLALGIVGLVILAFLVFRPVAQRRRVAAADHARAEALVSEYGWDTLAYFALRDDKSLFFASDGQAMIAYTYLQGYALASGDPIGSPESIPLVLDEFRAFCDERGWRVAFLAVREADLPLYEARGMRGVYIGDEAIIRCDRWDLDRPEMRKLRQAVSHVARGHSFELIRESEAGPQLVDELNGISERWRGSEPERGFTMALGRDVTGESEDMILCIARPAAGGAPIGFLRLVPCVGDAPGYSLDLMRREPEAPNGTTEFLIARTAEALGERRVVRLSMNFAALGRLFDAEAELGTRDRILKRVVAKLNPYFQIQSLHDFNQRFEPEWLPRAIVVEGAADIPHVGLLYAGVEGFVRIPVIGGLLVPPVVVSDSS